LVHAGLLHRGGCNVVAAGTVPGPNWIQSPDNFAASDWTATAATTAGSAGIAPDGTNNLSTLTDNSTNSNHAFYQGGLNPQTAGIYTFSVYLKQGTIRYAQLFLVDNAGFGFGSMFDLQAGTVGVSNIIGSAPTGTSASIASTSITGLYLATITMNFTGGIQNLYPSVALSNSATPAYGASGNPSYVGSGQTILAWNATLTTAISIGNVCIPPAQPWITAGYNINTFHVGAFSAANVDTLLTRNSGFQFYLTGSFTFPDTPASGLTFNGDGSLTLTGASGAGAAIYSIAAKGTLSSAWRGTAFGGGAYFEAKLSFTPNDVNSVNGANGFPAWWADPVEHGAESYADQWQGQAAGYAHFTETDFLEYNVWTSDNRLFQYNGTVIDWSGIFSGGVYPNQFQNSNNRQITLPVGTDLTQPHRYGFLWVPATGVANSGYFQWYFDGVATSARVTYSQYNCASSPSPPPTTSSPWLYGVLDCQHPELILNSPKVGSLRIYTVDVWQATSSNNIVK